ncbi:hydroxymethylcytosylglucuronate/cytosylglucuronate synthase [Streptomyces sp. NPDC006458]|uniref:hydroxymethylcytosylglucuronate/cytosylglucurona te synthase n=1 Tax=Streptomyces sp. NPDC006458 TaxID=3154302 RepID=UPI0033B5E704
MNDPQASRVTPRPAPTIRPALTRPVSLAVAGDDFGWGSVGLLAAILGALGLRENGRNRYLGLDTNGGRPVLRHHAVHHWADTSSLTDAELRDLLARHSVEAALVVLNAELAMRLEALDCRVVYVDTNPFMWTEHELVPQHVTRYCAQLCPALPQPCWPVLRGISSLHWVGRIIGPHPSEPAAPVPGKAVLNFGGLHSPATSSGSIEAYVRLVATAMLRAFQAHGYDQVVITGNLDPDRLPLPADLTRGMKLSGGRLPRERFLNELATADIVATSPGQTTLLELGALGRRAVVLPPQNLSQILHAAEVAQVVDPGIVVSWPPGTVDQDRVARERTRGEDWAITTMYSEISAAAAARPEGIPQLAQACTRALTYARNKQVDLTRLGAVTGNEGADTVADILHDLLRSR